MGGSERERVREKERENFLNFEFSRRHKSNISRSLHQVEIPAVVRTYMDTHLHRQRGHGRDVLRSLKKILRERER